MTENSKVQTLVQVLTNNTKDSGIDVLTLQKQRDAYKFALDQHVQHNKQLKEEIAEINSTLRDTQADRDIYKNMFEKTREQLEKASERLESYVPLETVEETVRKTTDALDESINRYETKFDRLRELCGSVDHIRMLAEEYLSDLKKTFQGFLGRVSTAMPKNSYKAGIDFKDSDALGSLDPEIVNGCIKIAREAEGNGKNNERFFEYKVKYGGETLAEIYLLERSSALIIGDLEEDFQKFGESIAKDVRRVARLVKIYSSLSEAYELTQL